MEKSLQQPWAHDKDQQLYSMVSLLRNEQTSTSAEWLLPIPFDSAEGKLPFSINPSRSLPFWRPLHVRPAVLSCFLAIFASLAISIEVLLAISNSSYGIATPASSKLRCSWTYGPTLVLTLLGAVWARTEFQTKIISAWFRFSQKPEDMTVMAVRDYVAMLLHSAIYRALKNGDHSVAATVVVSLLFKIMIVFSTGLIMLSSMEVTTSGESITVQGQFLNDSVGLNISGLVDSSYGIRNVMHGIIRANLTYPPGLTPQVAYQEVSANVSNDATITSVVDGLAPSFNCHQATINATVFELHYDYYDDYATVNVTLSTPDCDMEVSLEEYWRFCDPDVDPDPSCVTEDYFANSQSAQCNRRNSTEGLIDNMRLALIFGRMRFSSAPRHSVPMTATFELLESAQVICNASYAIQPYHLVQKGAQMISLSPVPDSVARVLPNIHGWDLANPDIGPPVPVVDFEDGWATNSQGLLLDLQGFWYKAWSLNPDLPDQENLSSLLDPMVLSEAFRGYMQRYMSAVAHYLLPATTSIRATGSVQIKETRLIVQRLATHTLFSILVVCTVSVLVVWSGLPNMRTIAQNPCSILGIAALLADIRPKNSVNRVRELQSPLLFRPWARLGMCVVLACAIVTLGALLHRSNSNDGIGPARSADRIHYLWTVGPAFVLSFIGLYFASIDSLTRAMEPYLGLIRGSNFEPYLALELMDNYQLSAIYRGRQMRLYSIVAVGVSALLASALPILSASLFGEVAMAQNLDSQLEILTVSGYIYGDVPVNTALVDYDDIMVDRISSILLQNDVPYPASTYEDLVFPEFRLQEHSRSISNPISVRAVVPAAQSRLTCRLYDRSQISVDFSKNYSAKIGAKVYRDPVQATFRGEECFFAYNKTNGYFESPGNRSVIPTNFVIATSGTDLITAPTDLQGIFGVGGETPYPGFTDHDLPYLSSCSTFLYVWGNFSPGLVDPVTSISAAGCNVSVDIIDTEIRFIGEDLQPYRSFPPLRNESSRRHSSSPNTTEWTWLDHRPDWFPDTHDMYPQSAAPNGSQLDLFFQVLTGSRYGVTKAGLADASQAQAVTDAIVIQHGIIMAQLYNEARQYVNNANFTTVDASLALPGRNSSIPFPAIIIDDSVPGRVVQDPASTYAVICVLLVILGLAVTTCVLAGDMAILPGSPTNVADLYALLAAGNVLDRLPENADMLDEKELGIALGGAEARFYLGWREKDRQGLDGEEGDEDEYMIYCGT